MKTEFYSIGTIDEEKFDFAVICAAYKGEWILVRHKERNTWELPGGRREENEDINVTASRELFEETGARDYELEHVCDYSVTNDGRTTFGRVFYARVTEIGPLPESEIGEVRLFKDLPDNMTYPAIQPLIHNRVLERLKDKVLKLLEKDRPRNIGIINIIKNYPVKTIDIVGDSVLIRERSDEDWVYIGCRSKDEFLRLIEGLDDEDKCFTVYEDWMIPLIVDNRETEFCLSCVKLVYDETVPLPPVMHDVVELTPADAPYVHENSRYNIRMLSMWKRG